jgi:hypothetical protein
LVFLKAHELHVALANNKQYKWQKPKYILQSHKTNYHIAAIPGIKNTGIILVQTQGQECSVCYFDLVAYNGTELYSYKCDASIQEVYTTPATANPITQENKSLASITITDNNNGEVFLYLICDNRIVCMTLGSPQDMDTHINKNTFSKWKVQVVYDEYVTSELFEIQYDSGIETGDITTGNNNNADNITTGEKTNTDTQDTNTCEASQDSVTTSISSETDTNSASKKPIYDIMTIKDTRRESKPSKKKSTKPKETKSLAPIVPPKTRYYTNTWLCNWQGKVPCTMSLDKNTIIAEEYVYASRINRLVQFNHQGELVYSITIPKSKSGHVYQVAAQQVYYKKNTMVIAVVTLNTSECMIFKTPKTSETLKMHQSSIQEDQVEIHHVVVV